jgi:UPF0176 protein
MRMPLIRPEDGRAPFVEAKTLKPWLDQGNDFEVDVGSFDNTIDYRITKFTEFPAVIEANRDALNNKTVVTFCTGSIGYEKAAIHIQ